MPEPRQLPSLTGLRAAAAGVVLVSHLRHLVPTTTLFSIGPARFDIWQLLRQGNAGVSLFFILSGFVLMWTHRPGDSARRFWVRRFARIYPSHVVVWVVSMGVIAAVGSIYAARGPALASLLLVQGWYPRADVYFWVVNAPVWSLCAEVFFYACFPVIAFLLLRVGERAWRRTAWIAAGLTVAVPIGCFIVMDQPDDTFWSYVFPPARLAEFVLGAALALLVRAGHLRSVPVGKPVILAVVAYVIAGRLPRVLANSLLTLVPFVLMIVSAAAADLADRRSFWRHPVIQHLGRVSFAVYLVQWGLIDVARRRVGGATTTFLGAFVVCSLTTVAIFVAAEALHFGIERPAERWIRRRWAHAEPTALVPVSG